MAIIEHNLHRRSRYKQTEVGVIPEEWRVETLGSVTTLLTNGFVGKATDFYTESDDGVLYIQGYNVGENTFNLHGIKRVSRDFHARHQKSCLQEGDLLTIQTGDIGVTSVIPHELVGANCHALVISRLNKRFYFPQYYCQYFNSKRGRDAFKEIETGSTMKHLNVGDMKNIFLPLPPLPEQTAIATALSDVDALITSLDKLIAKKRDIKQATIQQLLTGKMWLPGFSREPKPIYKRTEVEPNPEGWNQYKFEQIATIRKKKIDPKRSGKHLFCIELEHIDQGSGQLIGYSTITEESSIKSQFITGDILFGRLRVYLRKYWLADREGVCSTEIWPLVPNEDLVIGPYLFQLVQTNQFIDTANSAYGTHMPRADWNVVKNYEILLPSQKEQQAIANILSDMDAEIVALEQKREKNRALKQGMMQELLTGKTRLL